MATTTFVDKVTVINTAWLNDTNSLVWTVFNGKTTAGTSGTLLRSNGTNIVNTTATFPTTGGTAGTLLRSDGTNWVNSTATFPTTTTANQLLYSSATNTVGGLATANNGVLVTSSGGIPSISSTLPVNIAVDDSFAVTGSSDATKKVRLEVDGLTTATTRVMTVPDYDLRIGNLPAGVVMDFAGAVEPTGWFFCNGAAISRTTYAALFAAIGTTWGVGNGSTTFNIPDFRGRARIGSGTGAGLSARTLAATGGEETHQLSTAELASHTHTQNSHTHTSTISIATATTAAVDAMAVGTRVTNGSGIVQSAAVTNVAATAVNQNAGSDTAHNTMMPFAVTMPIISY
jgi:microcystin-dependent protein